MFRIRVLADFGDGELVWTLTSNGQTERAYGALKPDYYIDCFVIQANNGAGGDVEKPFGSGLNEQRLEIVTVADPIVPPPGVLIPYSAILVGVFRKF